MCALRSGASSLLFSVRSPFGVHSVCVCLCVGVGVTTVAAACWQQHPLFTDIAGDTLRLHPSQKHHLGKRLANSKGLTNSCEQKPASHRIRGPGLSGVVSLRILLYRCEDRIPEVRSSGPVSWQQRSWLLVQKSHRLSGLELGPSNERGAARKGGPLSVLCSAGCTRGSLSEPHAGASRGHTDPCLH